MWRNTCKASEVPLKGVIEAKSFESGRELNFDVHRQKFTPKKTRTSKTGSISKSYIFGPAKRMVPLE